MKVRIEIDTRTFVRFWLVVIGFIVAGYLIYSSWAALIIIGAALFLAITLNAPVTWIAKRLPGKSRVLATLISFVGVLLVLGAIIFLVIPPIATQTAKFIDSIPSLVESASERWRVLQDFVDKYNLQDQINQAIASLEGSATKWVSNIGQTLITGIGSIISFLTAAFLTIILAFLMLVEGPDWLRRIWKIYGDEARMKHHQKIIHRMRHAITGYVSGALIISTIGSTVAGIIVYVLSFIFPAVTPDLAVPTAAISFLFSLIPMFGTTVGAIVVAGLLALNSVPAAIAYIVAIIIYQQIENNLIAPNVQAKTVDLSALAVLIAVTIGIYLFGLVGAIISIPVAGCVRVLIEEYVASAKMRREKSVSKLEKFAKKLSHESA